MANNSTKNNKYKNKINHYDKDSNLLNKNIKKNNL